MSTDSILIDQSGYEHDGTRIACHSPDLAAEIDERNGWMDSLPPSSLGDDSDTSAKLADLMLRLLTWLDSNHPERSWRKVKALLYTLAPETLPSGPSMVEIAALCGITPQSFNQYIHSLREHFDIHPKFGRSHEARANLGLGQKRRKQKTASLRLAAQLKGGGSHASQ
jgi:hypothetical protein